MHSVSKAINGDVVAIDGKTLRCSYDQKSGILVIHMASAWSSKNGVVSVQEKTAGRSNKTTIIPTLLEALEFKGCIVIINRFIQTPINHQ